MRFTAKVAAARAVAGLSRVTRTGGGTTAPGKLLLSLDHDAIRRLAARLERGSVVISATNGKTTTAKMLAGLLEPELEICHNRSGANLTSGVATALLEASGKSVGVFEVDEAALPAASAALDPAVLVLGNLFRDQLDRYGELEAIGAAWAELTGSLEESCTLVRNGDDPLLASLPSGAAGTVTFGIADSSAALAEMPHAADSKWCARCGHRLVYTAVFLGHLGGWECPVCGNRRPALDVSAAAIEQEGLDACSFTLHTPLGERRVRLPVAGMYNVYNALAATAAAHALGGVELDRMVAGLERFDPAFGRFERVLVDGEDVLLLLVKNPAGGNEVLRTLAVDERPKRLLLALNDRTADGRDVSWIWDVDFELLAPAAVVTTGTRAAEMALRLAYAGVDQGRITVEPDLEAALDRALAGGEGPLYLLATYTAMLDLRGILADRGVVRPYWEAE